MYSQDSGKIASWESIYSQAFLQQTKPSKNYPQTILHQIIHHSTVDGSGIRLSTTWDV